jgi:hypothetical protein
MTSPIRRPDVSFIPTAPRPTPTPVRAGASFAMVMGGVARGAQVAVNLIPGSSALGLRLGGGSLMGTSAGRMSVASSPEGPGGVGVSVGAGAGGGAAGGVEDALANAAEQNMYYLQLQEAVNAQNRQFSVLSNIEKSEHDTLKNTISNLR